MAEVIFLIIFIISLGGIFFIMARKVPVLVQLPQNGGVFEKGKIASKTEEKIKFVYDLFKKQILLHKFLSWVKCLTLRIETRIDSLLHKIRKKAQQAGKNLNEKK